MSISNSPKMILKLAKKAQKWCAHFILPLCTTIMLALYSLACPFFLRTTHNPGKWHMANLYSNERIILLDLATACIEDFENTSCIWQLIWLLISWHFIKTFQFEYHIQWATITCSCRMNLNPIFINCSHVLNIPLLVIIWC